MKNRDDSAAPVGCTRRLVVPSGVAGFGVVFASFILALRSFTIVVMSGASIKRAAPKSVLFEAVILAERNYPRRLSKQVLRAVKRIRASLALPECNLRALADFKFCSDAFRMITMEVSHP